LSFFALSLACFIRELLPSECANRIHRSLDFSVTSKRLFWQLSKKNKPYDPRNRWSAKYRKDVGLWIPSLKVTYLYWFKFLQIAERDPILTVDWSKYDGWGGRDVVLNASFDEWWSRYWKDLFGIEKEGDVPKFPLSTKRPKTDAIRYAFRLYENRHRGSNWEIAVWLKKNEKRGYFLEFFGKIDEEAVTKTRLMKDEFGIDRDQDSVAYLNRLNKQDVQRKVGRYLKAAKKHLDNVCNGIFP